MLTGSTILGDIIASDTKSVLLKHTFRISKKIRLIRVKAGVNLPLVFF